MQNVYIYQFIFNFVSKVNTHAYSPATIDLESNI